MTTLLAEYQRRYKRVLVPMALRLEDHLRGLLDSQPRIDRISVRAKAVNSFINKADRIVGGQQKYSEPLNQIQDQIGARIVTFYLQDVDRVSAVIQKYFRSIEERELVPETPWSFGYFGKHYVLLVPSDVVDPATDAGNRPRFFELQIKTLFQHAWSEANHDLGYKPGVVPLPRDAERGLAFASAQAWGADRMFEELLANDRRHAGKTK